MGKLPYLISVIMWVVILSITDNWFKVAAAVLLPIVVGEAVNSWQGREKRKHIFRRNSNNTLFH